MRYAFVFSPPENDFDLEVGACAFVVEARDVEEAAERFRSRERPEVSGTEARELGFLDLEDAEGWSVVPLPPEGEIPERFALFITAIESVETEVEGDTAAQAMRNWAERTERRLEGTPDPDDDLNRENESDDFDDFDEDGSDPHFVDGLRPFAAGEVALGLSGVQPGALWPLEGVAGAGKVGVQIDGEFPAEVCAVPLARGQQTEHEWVSVSAGALLAVAGFWREARTFLIELGGQAGVGPWVVRGRSPRAALLAWREQCAAEVVPADAPLREVLALVDLWAARDVTNNAHLSRPGSEWAWTLADAARDDVPAVSLRLLPLEGAGVAEYTVSVLGGVWPLFLASRAASPLLAVHDVAEQAAGEVQEWEEMDLGCGLDGERLRDALRRVQAGVQPLPGLPDGPAAFSLPLPEMGPGVRAEVTAGAASHGADLPGAAQEQVRRSLSLLASLTTEQHATPWDQALRRLDAQAQQGVTVKLAESLRGLLSGGMGSFNDLVIGTDRTVDMVLDRERTRLYEAALEIITLDRQGGRS